MNFLILINPARNYKKFFHKLSSSLQDSGHSVHFAVDSQYSAAITPIKEIDEGRNTHFFDQYFRSHFLQHDPSKTEYIYNATWGEFFYSDFDRFLCQSYNLRRNRNYWIAARKCLDDFFQQLITELSIDVVLYENISNSFEFSA